MVRPRERLISDEERRQYCQEVDKFLAADETTHAAFEQGLRFHRERPIFNPATEFGQGLEVLPDLEERLNLAMTAQKSIRRQHTEDYNVEDYTFSLIQLSAFVFSDLDFLRHTSILEGYMQYRRLISTEAFLAIFLQRPSKSRDTTAPSSSKRPTPTSSPAASRKQKVAKTQTSAKGKERDDSEEAYQPNRKGDKVERNEKESQQALERDGAVCVITGSIHPDTCHIWPFAVNSNVDNFTNTREVLSKSIGVLSPTILKRLFELLTPENEELGSSDKSWNMIALSPELHRYWSKAYFGLKWIGADSLPSGDNNMATFKVEWRWLPRDVVGALERKLGKLKRTSHKSIPEIDLESEETVNLVCDALREGWTLPNSVFPELARAKYASSSRPVETGHVISLRVKRDDLDKTETLIKAQWLAVQMAALSGAGEIVDELVREPPRPMDPPDAIRPSLQPREADDIEQLLPDPSIPEEEG